MIRTQIQLTAEQSQALKELATEENISMAEIIRRAVDHWLQITRSVSMEERKRRAIAAVGQFRSGLSDVSEKHDEYLIEAYQHEHFC
ncbi:MAG: ribbon-helix-helix protein, CopG family [Anaerolineae bacterium]|nr:ribbon-helix-helix protein, CopG family [Anaerolineae bacterium]